MWSIIKSWLAGNILKLMSIGLATLSVMTVLFGARQAGRNAERADQLKKALEIKNGQLRATLDAPRTRSELSQQLRDGKF